MRGVTPVDLPVPRGGWRTDTPPHLIPADGLSDGLNLFVDEDGLLHSRRGYDRLAEQLPFTERVMKGVSWQDSGGQQLVVAGLTHWAALEGGGFVDITGDPNSGDPATPTRFAQFGFLPSTSRTILYGVNGAIHDPMRYWVTGDAAYKTMVDVAHGDFTFAANDITVVADRLVAINTTENGVQNPRRVRWSSVLNGQSWSSLAFSDRLGDAGNLVAIQLTSRTSAVLYCENGAWLMTATYGGDDATAFQFDRIFGVVVGPYSPDSIINKGGVHYLLATDRRVWVCDGSNAEIISEPIDAGLQQRLAVGAGSVGGLDEGSAQKPVGVYDIAHRRFIWFVAFKGEQESYHAIVLNLFTKHWEPPWQLADPITAAFAVTELFGPTWDNPGIDPSTGQPWTWDTAPWPSWNDIPENFSRALYVGTVDGTLYRFGSAASDNGKPISYVAIWGLRWPQDMTKRQQVNTAEVLLQPISAEPLTMRLRGFRTVFDPTPVTILNQVVAQDQPAQWLVRLSPEVATAAFKNANYFEASVSGTTTQGAPVFAGETLFAFIVERPDVEAGATANY
ncbi:hypothetical protein EPO05_06140 [Patescibacteria group bacterium]|nr:MAG: hypothetical protein EPO05_06140 [Patescibacteria group bacterium]